MAEIDINERINNLITLSVEKFHVKNYNDAIRDLKAAEVLDRNNPEILYNLGVNYARLGLYRTAIEYFNRLISAPNDFIEPLNIKKILAISLIKTVQYQKAAELLAGIIKLNPGDIAAISMLGYCFERDKKFFEAIRTYKRVIELDTRNFNAYNSLAYIYVTTGGDLDKALEYARMCYRSNVTNPAYIDTLGYVYLKMNRLAEAALHLEKALSLQPFSPDIKAHVMELSELRKRGGQF